MARGAGGGKAGDGLHAIVLAAGASSRFGSPKQLVRIAGRPLLHCRRHPGRRDHGQRPDRRARLGS